jgi:hypothetical protein
MPAQISLRPRPQPSSARLHGGKACAASSMHRDRNSPFDSAGDRLLSSPWWETLCCQTYSACARDRWATTQHQRRSDLLARRRRRSTATCLRQHKVSHLRLRVHQGDRGDRGVGSRLEVDSRAVALRDATKPQFPGTFGSCLEPTPTHRATPTKLLSCLTRIPLCGPGGGITPCGSWPVR